MTYTFLIPEVIAQIFNPFAELAIPIGIPIKYKKAEIEIYPVIVEFGIKPIIFNISIDSSSLNNFSFLFLCLLQIIERTVFSVRYDILGFSNFLYLPQIMQYSFFIFLVNKNILVLFYHSFHNH